MGSVYFPDTSTSSPNKVTLWYDFCVLKLCICSIDKVVGDYLVFVSTCLFYSCYY